MSLKFSKNDWRPWLESVVVSENVRNLPLQNMLCRLGETLMTTNRLASFATEAILIWPRCTPGENLDVLATDEKDFAADVTAAAGLSDYKRKLLLRYLATRGIKSLEQYPRHPEFFAFQFARGQFLNSVDGKWKFHHLYNGQCPFPHRRTSLDARKHGYHFTQTAGMVCVHPIVHELYSQFRSIRYIIRARSFLLFDYDPDHYFSRQGHNRFGFVEPEIRPEVLDEDEPLVKGRSIAGGLSLAQGLKAGFRPRRFVDEL